MSIGEAERQMLQKLWKDMGDEYVPDVCLEIAKAAGLEKEYECSTGENVEQVLSQALDILHIEW